jgi:hypothetical protein
MMGRPKTRWVFLLSLMAVLTAFTTVKSPEAAVGKWVGTQTCINCHSTWLDNDPPTEDVTSGRVSTDYLPLNLSTSRTPWYTIPEGYVNSLHYTPAFDLAKKDEVQCEGCHGSGQAHYGVGSIPTPIPNSKKCMECHTPAHGFNTSAFLKTAHANSNMKPGKYFDQASCGLTQAKISAKSPVSNAPVGTPLFKQGTFSQPGDPVSKDERVEECSTCHQYAMQYPQFRKKILQGNLPLKPEVTCGACHDAHIIAPDGLHPAIVTTSVVVNQITGSSTVVSVSKVPGRAMSYINNKPYPVNDSGAMDVNKGTWTRGSAINRPMTTLMKGGCAVASSGDGTCTLITLTCDLCPGVEGFLKNQVKEGDTISISGVASVTVPLPADAKLAGRLITLQATLDGGTYEIIRIIDDKTVLVGAPVVASTSVTYILADGKTTATLPVDVSFCGLSVDFEVRDTLTNTEDLCMSCHTRGTYKYTKWGKKSDGSLVNLSPSHNLNIGGQFKTSGHADRLAPAWEEFFTFGGHNLNWPYDMSITGSGGAGSLRNKGKTTFKLTSPDNLLAYLSQKGNANLASTTGSFNCLQCHNGLTAIDYLNDVQGTSAASVVWGDATLTCITCHDPHKDQINGKEPNLRKPVKLSYNSRFVDATKNPRGGINKMMDGTDIPSGVDTGIICLFCHQGRESGLTVYINITSNGVNPYTDPDKVIKGGSGISFQNPHYLESGAILWSKNSWEYLTVSGAPTPNKYSNGIPDHQETNCAGCHMAEASPSDFEGGHTWRPRIEVCQKCHGSTIQTFQDIKASADWDGNGKVESAFAEIGTLSPDTGLFGQLKAALQAKGIYYNPDQNPYFFTGPDFKTNYTAWTSNTLTAAFNLQFNYKAGGCSYVHNPFYAAQILQDSLKAIKAPVKPWVRPAGDRPATDYRTIVVNP